MNDRAALWILIGLVALGVIIALAVAARRRARDRTAELRERFGPEYDRAVEAHGNAARAERDLASRERRVERFHFRDLTEAERATFGAAWERIQAQFVDDPAGAAVGANELIAEVMRARGYPTDDFEHQAEDLSVDHAAVIQHYRAAMTLTQASRDGAPHTEELRQALVHYRTLFADLLRTSSAAVLREAHG
jgi:hypothetical protein